MGANEASDSRLSQHTFQRHLRTPVSLSMVAFRYPPKLTSSKTKTSSPSATIFKSGGSRLPLKSFILNADIRDRCLATPCHTKDSICYYITDASNKSQAGGVFTGDTLFQGKFSPDARRMPYSPTPQAAVAVSSRARERKCMLRFQN